MNASGTSLKWVGPSGVALPGLDQVEVLRAADLAEHDVAHREFLRLRRHHRAKIAGLNLARPGIPARTKLHRLAPPEIGLEFSRPAWHTRSVLTRCPHA